MIALGFVYSGYFAETFRAGIQSIPAGHLEAGRACGMSERLILWRIILPQVVRRMLPEAINLFVSLFKATTIVSLIAVPDLMYQVSMVMQQEMRPLPLYTGAALDLFRRDLRRLQRGARCCRSAGAARSTHERAGPPQARIPSALREGSPLSAPGRPSANPERGREE